MALSRGELHAPEYGASNSADNIDGIELLGAVKEGKNETEAAQALVTEKVLSPEDFKKLRKLRLQRSIERQMGGKRNALEAGLDVGSSSDENGSDEDASSVDSSEEEAGLQGRLPGSVSAEALKSHVKSRKSNKHERLQKVKTGRTDKREELRERQKNRKGGKTNVEKRRNNPLMMAVHSKRANSKRNMNSKQKFAGMKKHLGTLKKKVGGKIKRRR